MPTYVYKCGECEEIFEYFHSYKVKMTTCESCGSEALNKMLNTPVNIAKRLNKGNASPGKIVKETIEETKQEMEREKKRLRSRENK
tara:strand:- start:161 stop:418 length:258 start_codon:yes stop_codon:yes gene_type:complete